MPGLKLNFAPSDCCEVKQLYEKKNVNNRKLQRGKILQFKHNPNNWRGNYNQHSQTLKDDSSIDKVDLCTTRTINYWQGRNNRSSSRSVLWLLVHHYMYWLPAINIKTFFSLSAFLSCGPQFVSDLSSSRSDTLGEHQAVVILLSDRAWHHCGLVWQQDWIVVLCFVDRNNSQILKLCSS